LKISRQMFFEKVPAKSNPWLRCTTIQWLRWEPTQVVSLQLSSLLP
jgi:hypothetical protein